MAARLSREERGVTLVELLVVLIIIGLLAAIVIAAFANQQDKAHDADAKTHARSAQTAMESFYVDTRATPASRAPTSRSSRPPSRTPPTSRS